ncbi:MAG: nucleotidyltransferase domain-containing protein [Planctomycetota bacterium]
MTASAAPTPPFWETGLILRVRSGSRAYGLAVATSDEDSRGVCVPPRQFLLGLDSFEQHESDGGDHVVYGLAKFARLALQGNPNIIETLFTPTEHVLHCDALGALLVAARGAFLSRRVGERFAGYATGQLTRMRNHRRALQTPGLSDERLARRNPARAELEARYGFDTKHAMHLIRLLRMGHEVLATGAVHVHRSDAQELLSIRHGGWSFERVAEEAARLLEQLTGAIAGSALPEAPDERAANELVIELHERALYGKRLG